MSASERRILVSVRLFELKPSLLALLREHRQRRNDGDPIAERYDAFLLDPGLGPAVFLSSDGRIIWDDDGWGVRVNRGEAFTSILAGVKKTGIAELRTLLPPRPAESADCAECAATGWRTFGDEAQGKVMSFLCDKCGGLGWTAPSVVRTESVLDTVIWPE